MPRLFTHLQPATMTTLSVLGLAHNSQQVLERYFTSLNGLADQIIIGDLGSTDTTASEAAKRGAIVLALSSPDDKAALRNELLCHATSDWILILDCSEAISNPDLFTLKKHLETTTCGAFILTVRNYTNNRHLLGLKPSDLLNYEGYVPAKQARLFCNKPFIRFAYPVHETIMPSLNGKGIVVQEIQDIFLRNYEYSSQLAKDHVILKKMHKDHPDDLKICYDLAVTELNLGKLTSAKKMFGKVSQELPSYKNVLTNLASLHLREGDAYTASKLYLQAIEINPKNLAAYHNLGRLFIKTGRLDKAEFLFKKALSIDQKEPRMIASLARVYSLQGKQQEARELVQKGLLLMPKNKILLLAAEKLERGKILSSDL